MGVPLTPEVLDGLIEKYGNDITCICFMGGDADPQSVIQMACYLRLHYPQFKIGWYSGRIRIPSIIRKEHFDYIKIGPYIAHLGGLKERTTNQRLYKRVDKADFVDITSAFWKK